MKTCKNCGHVELSIQELDVFKKTIRKKVSSTDLVDVVKNRKIAYEILSRLEKYGFVKRVGNYKKSVIWTGGKSCVSCRKFKFMSAFNTWGCSQSQGIYDYCNDYKMEKNKS